MAAETLVGNGDQAFDYYLRINPSARESISEIHRGEPYVYSQMIAGRDAAAHGEAKNSWLTGTAAWNYTAITQYILGIQPDYDGLRINPCIPAEWRVFIVQRVFRGSRYKIRVNNPLGVNSGVFSMRVDGQMIQGSLAPLFEDEKTHLIEISLGEK
jgi:cellobiose phosphorylase